MATIQATRVKKGMLVKMGEDLYRILDFQHVTPGNLRGFVRVKLRNIRNGALADQKLRSEDMIERATLDEREMQYCTRTATTITSWTRRPMSRSTSRARRWAIR